MKSEEFVAVFAKSAFQSGIQMGHGPKSGCLQADTGMCAIHSNNTENNTEQTHP